MKERPLICSAWEVQALLAGRKTQLMRPIKRSDGCAPLDYYDGMFWFSDGDAITLATPLGVPGDRVWIKETYGFDCVAGADECFHNDCVHYRADITDAHAIESWKGHWKSPASMPRKFCRLIVEIEEVSVCKVQEISEADAIAEGVEIWVRNGGNVWTAHESLGLKTIGRLAYRSMWDARYAKQGYPFAGNPWAWKYTVKAVK